LGKDWSKKIKGLGGPVGAPPAMCGGGGGGGVESAHGRLNLTKDGVVQKKKKIFGLGLVPMGGHAQKESTGHCGKNRGDQRQRRGFAPNKKPSVSCVEKRAG